MTDRLDPQSAREILRRASELDVGSGSAELGYDREALAQAAAEVGIRRRSLEQALAEHDVGLLTADEGSGGLLGRSRVVVTRTVPLSPEEAQRRTTRWLGRQMLEVSERREREEVWRPRGDLAAKVRRKIDARITRQVRLGNVDAIRVSAAEVGDGESVLCLEAELDDMRRGLTTGVVAVPTAVTPVLGGVGVLLTGELAFLFGSIPLGLTLGGLGIYGGRRTLAHERDDARRVLELFLDELA